jgi:serine/threonine-protein kinase
VQHAVGEQVATGRRTLTARYALDHVLARGGAGEVWRARDLRLGRPVAVKMLHGAQTDPQFRTRFEAEARHTARLSHPHIATVYDYGEEEGVDGDERTPYLVLELVEGESLADLLARRGRLGVDRTLSILRQLSSALAAAHEAGVVHRDVKPANVLVRRDGVVKITDFGIAASAAGAPLTAPGQVVGTARYLSPEQARGGHGTPASDVYALGLVGYECLAGHPAFDGDDPVDVAMKQIADPPPPLPPDVPPAVRGLVGRATAKDPPAACRTERPCTTPSTGCWPPAGGPPGR